MKVMIWIPDNLVDEVKDAAWKSKMSVSNYLVSLHRDRGKSSITFFGDGEKHTGYPNTPDLIYISNEESDEKEFVGNIGSQPVYRDKPKKVKK